MIDLNKLVSENKIVISYDDGKLIATDCYSFEEIVNIKIQKIIVGIEINSIPEDFLYIDKCLIIDENDNVIYNEQRHIDGRAYTNSKAIQTILSEFFKVHMDDIYVQE